MISKSKKIIIVAGDPNSINSEIIYKSWKKLNKDLKKKILLIANFELIKKQFKKTVKNKVKTTHFKKTVLKNPVQTKKKRSERKLD